MSFLMFNLEKLFSSNPVLSGGDFRFFWQESIKDFAIFPTAWDSSLNTGTGASQLSSLWITSFLNFTAFFSKLGLSWSLIQLLFWILPAILLSFFSSFFLFKTLFKFKVQYSIFAGIIYTLNTYFLMILTGGQLGVSLSYSLVPLVILKFIKTLENSTFKNLILTGLALSLQIIFDPRIVYVTLFAVLIYCFFNLSKLKNIKNKLFLLTPFIIAVLLNSFWILSLILTKNSSFPVGFDSVSGFKFFSFAKLENSISLLHPNWPENIFGKVYFLKPEFLILPIIAFSSLLFNKTRIILFFSFLALIGTFLAKGANEPLGFVNEFLFQHFLGMTVFRDPTKFYLLIALSYSILIPFSIYSISGWFNSKLKDHLSPEGENLKIQIKIQKYLPHLFLIFTILYLLFLVSPIFGQIKIHQVPQEYAQLKDFLNSQNKFSRTLWIPQWQRFGYFSNKHPAIGREEVFKGNAKKQISQIDQDLLRDFSIKYVIVPDDSQGEIFLKDRKYDEKAYRKTIEDIRKIKWLKEVNCSIVKLLNCSGDPFGKIKVFEALNPKDHFWSRDSNLKINYKYINPTKYEIDVQNAKKGDIIVFSEGFDNNWKASFGNQIVSSKKYGQFNSFVISKNGAIEAEIFYEPQKWVNIGLWISGVILLAVVGCIGFGYMSKKW